MADFGDLRHRRHAPLPIAVLGVAQMGAEEMTLTEVEYLEGRIKDWKAKKPSCIEYFGEDYYERHLKKLEDRLERAEAGNTDAIVEKE